MTRVIEMNSEHRANVALEELIVLSNEMGNSK
jgi:hypothetical protein